MDIFRPRRSSIWDPRLWHPLAQVRSVTQSFLPGWEFNNLVSSKLRVGAAFRVVLVTAIVLVIWVCGRGDGNLEARMAIRFGSRREEEFREVLKFDSNGTAIFHC